MEKEITEIEDPIFYYSSVLFKNIRFHNLECEKLALFLELNNISWVYHEGSETSIDYFIIIQNSHPLYIFTPHTKNIEKLEIDFSRPQKILIFDPIPLTMLIEGKLCLKLGEGFCVFPSLSHSHSFPPSSPSHSFPPSSPSHSSHNSSCAKLLKISSKENANFYINDNGGIFMEIMTGKDKYNFGEFQTTKFKLKYNIEETSNYWINHKKFLSIKKERILREIEKKKIELKNLEKALISC